MLVSISYRHVSLQHSNWACAIGGPGYKDFIALPQLVCLASSNLHSYHLICHGDIAGLKLDQLSKPQKPENASRHTVANRMFDRQGCASASLTISDRMPPISVQYQQGPGTCGHWLLPLVLPWNWNVPGGSWASTSMLADTRCCVALISLVPALAISKLRHLLALQGLLLSWLLCLF